MTNKQKYREFCVTELDIPVFSKDWWLDAVVGEKNWDVVLVEKGGVIVGSLPYFIKKKLFFDIITMPQLTQTLGPYIKYPQNQKSYKKLSWEKEIFSMLISGLPSYASFVQNFSHSITNWLPFYWHGFSQTTRYTYRIFGIDEDKLNAEYETDIRRRRRKAENSGVVIKEIYSVDEFYSLNEQTFSRKKMQIPYQKELVQNLYDVGVKNKAVKMFAAFLPNGEMIAANFLIFDKNTVYYLMGGIDPNKKDIGGMDLIQHYSILFALETGRVFDFEGSMVESIEKYFRSFGAHQVPYFSITHTPSFLYSTLKSIKKLIKK